MTTKLDSSQVHHQLQNHHGTSNTVGEARVPMGVADRKSTITRAPKKDCCDYIVPPEKQPNFWQKLTPCQKTTICCGSVIVIEAGTIGALIGTGTVSTSEGAGAALIVIGICCAIKIALGGLCCYAKFSSQEE